MSRRDAQRPQTAASRSDSRTITAQCRPLSAMRSTPTALTAFTPTHIKKMPHTLLKRRDSTPNTIDDIVHMFEPKATQSPAETSFSCAPINRSHVVRPQTVAFLQLLSQPQSLSSNTGVLAESDVHVPVVEPPVGGVQSPIKNRPSSAPFAPVKRRIVSSLTNSDGEPNAVHGSESNDTKEAEVSPVSRRQRPQSAQGFRCRLDVARTHHCFSTTKIASCGTTTVHPLPQRSETSGNSRSGEPVEGNSKSTTKSSFSATVFPVDVTLRETLAAGVEELEAYAPVIRHVECVCASELHQDATAAGAQPFPLSAVSPWSMVRIEFRVQREKIVFYLSSPASMTLGARVFRRILRTLSISALVKHATALLDEDYTVLHEGHRDYDEMELLLCEPPLPANVPNEAVDDDAAAAAAASTTAMESRNTSPVSPSSPREHRRTLVKVDSFCCGVGNVSSSMSPTAGASPKTSSDNLFRLRSMASLRGRIIGVDRAKAVVTTSDRQNDEDDDEAVSGGSRAAFSTMGSRRVSMFHAESSKILSAVASIRNMSFIHSPLSQSEASPTVQPISGKSSASPDRRRFSRVASRVSITARAFVSKDSRKRIAVVIAVSTFQDTSIANCRQIYDDAMHLTEQLRNECGFDLVIPMTSENPEREEWTPTMANLKKVTENILLNWILTENSLIEPLVCFFLLSRGFVAEPGSVSGLSHRSTTLVPFQLSAYSESRSHEPAPGVKIAFLESARVDNLRSVDVVTPEMFFDMLQANGKVYHPVVFADVWSCGAVNLPVVRKDSEGCGFSGWYASATPEVNFTSIPRKGVGGVATYYLLKLLEGASVRSAAKLFIKRGGIVDAPITDSVSRLCLSGLSIDASMVHHYIVPRLQRRSHNVMFSVAFRIDQTVSETTLVDPKAPVNQLTSPSIDSVPFPLRRLARLVMSNGGGDSDASPTTTVDRVRQILEKVATVLCTSREFTSASQEMYQVDVDAPIFELSGQQHAGVSSPTVSARRARKLKLLDVNDTFSYRQLVNTCLSQQLDDGYGHSHRVPCRTWQCRVNPDARITVSFRYDAPPGVVTYETGILRDLDNFASIVLGQLEGRGIAAEAECSLEALTVSFVITPNDIQRCRSRWLNDQLIKLVDTLTQFSDTFANSALTPTRCSISMSLDVSLSKEEAKKINLCIRMRSLTALGELQGVRAMEWPFKTMHSRYSTLQLSQYASIWRLQCYWKFVLPLRHVLQRIRTLLSNDEPQSRQAVYGEETTLRATSLLFVSHEITRQHLAQEATETVVSCIINDERESRMMFVLPEAAELSLMEEGMYRRRIMDEQSLEMLRDVEEAAHRQHIEHAWRYPCRLANGVSSSSPSASVLTSSIGNALGVFAKQFELELHEASDRYDVRRMEERNMNTLAKLMSSLLEDMGIHEDDVVSHRFQLNPYDHALQSFHHRQERLLREQFEAS